MTDEFDPKTGRAGPGWPVVVVASAFKTGVLAARSLERRGVRVVLVDCNKSVEGFSSIHGTTLLCPNPDRKPDDWLSFMQQLAKRLGGRPVLMAASDQFVSAIGLCADELATHYRLSSCTDLQAALAVKEGQIQLAHEHGLPMPHTRYVVNEAEAAAFAETAKYPVLIKPRQHRYWCKAGPGHPMYQVKVVQADNPPELMRKYRLAAQLSKTAVLQEKIEGPDTNKRVHIAVYRQDGLRLAHLTLKELRCTRFGVPTVCEPVDDPKVAQICDRFFQASGYRGTCEIELVWDERDNTPKMMDINPRFSGSGDATTYAGIDQAWLVYLDLIGAPVEPVTPAPRDFRHIMLENDMLAIRQYWQDGLLSWSNIRRCYRRPIHFWDFELRDWRLATRTLWRTVRLAAGTVALQIWCRLAKSPNRQPAPIVGAGLAKRIDWLENRQRRHGALGTSDRRSD